MSVEFFSKDCQGCRPAMAEVDTKTGSIVKMPDDHPLMKKVNKVYDESSREEHIAFHKMACLNDTSDENMAVLQPMMDKIREVTKSWEPSATS